MLFTSIKSNNFIEEIISKISYYLFLKASFGDKDEARIAGQKPETTPMKDDKIIVIITNQIGVINKVNDFPPKCLAKIFNIKLKTLEDPTPSNTPQVPPKNPIRNDSIRKRFFTSRSVAPKDFIIPTS